MPVTSAPTDRSSELAGWLARTALGDRSAFAALYTATSAHLFGVILRINADRPQAEELLQDIYVNIWRAAGGYDAARAQPMTWLVSIARNRAIDSLRRAKSEVKTVSRSAPGAEGEDDIDLLAARLGDALVWVRQQPTLAPLTIGLFGAMLWIDWQLTLVAIVVVPFVAGPIIAIGKKLRRVATPGFETKPGSVGWSDSMASSCASESIIAWKATGLQLCLCAFGDYYQGIQ